MTVQHWQVTVTLPAPYQFAYVISYRPYSDGTALAIVSGHLSPMNIKWPFAKLRLAELRWGSIRSGAGRGGAHLRWRCDLYRRDHPVDVFVIRRGRGRPRSGPAWPPIGERLSACAVKKRKGRMR